MKITKRQLRRIIKEALLKEHMLNIIANPHSPETETFNRIVNYAINNDLEGALADTEWVNTPDLDLDLDGIGEWIDHVGDPEWMSSGTVVPDNWDPDAVWDFIGKLEKAWHAENRKSGDNEHHSSPNMREREAIGRALGRSYVLPEDLPSISYQIRRKGGKPSIINIEDENSMGNLSLEDTNQFGTTFRLVTKVLDAGGARLIKRRKRNRSPGPIYD